MSLLRTYWNAPINIQGCDLKCKSSYIFDVYLYNLLQGIQKKLLQNMRKNLFDLCKSFNDFFLSGKQQEKWRYRRALKFLKYLVIFLSFFSNNSILLHRKEKIFIFVYLVYFYLFDLLHPFSSFNIHYVLYWNQPIVFKKIV